ncbi:hypothetical protein J8J40_24145, partial [Mycobacterium tuberculosis]|nr:hypothetical protein [Mycobacterium tuberculosis]
MKIAVAGLGFRIANVLKSFRKALPDVAVVGLVDPAPAGLDVIEGLGLTVGARFETVEAMLAATKPDLFMV